MKLEEYHALKRVEREHWFYKGKRDLVRWWIEKIHGPLTASDTILDAGAGTGEFVRELSALAETRHFSIIGLEFEAEARTIAREVNGIELLSGSILDIPLGDNSVTISCALDVLEHVEDDGKAFGELLRVTEPGGLVIINVPAFMSLWSEWDVTLGHYRRYTRQTFMPLINEPVGSGTVEVVYAGYINVVAFPLVYLYRRFRRIFPSDSRAEDSIPPRWINSLMYSLFLTPAKWGWMRAPFGVSFFCVLRKVNVS